MEEVKMNFALGLDRANSARLWVPRMLLSNEARDRLKSRRQALWMMTSTVSKTYSRFSIMLDQAVIANSYLVICGLRKTKAVLRDVALEIHQLVRGKYRSVKALVTESVEMTIGY